MGITEGMKRGVQVVSALVLFSLVLLIATFFGPGMDLTSYLYNEPVSLDSIYNNASNNTEIHPPLKYNVRNEIFLRAPYFLILGTQKGGTSAMRMYLKRHPQITYHEKAELYFFSWYFGPMINQTASRESKKEVILIHKARRAHANFYPYQKLKNDSSLVAFDSTPDYLFQSDMIAPRVKAVNPWAKLLVLLRNPVDRAYSDYTMEVNRNRLQNVTFEEYVESDFQRMERANLIDAWNGTAWDEEAFANFRGSTEEDVAWGKYWRIRNKGMHPLGRGVYAIQIRQWLRVYNVSSPTTDNEMKQFLFLRQEETKGQNGTNAAFNRIVDFLGLRPHRLGPVQPKHVGKYKQGEIKETTRARLEEFFRPYNQQLVDLLGQEWEGVWEKVPRADDNGNTTMEKVSRADDNGNTTIDEGKTNDDNNGVR